MKKWSDRIDEITQHFLESFGELSAEQLYRQRSGLVSQHEVLLSKTTSSRVYTRVKRCGFATPFRKRYKLEARLRKMEF